MVRPTTGHQGSDAAVVEACELWAKSFGAAALTPADAPDLVESAQRITQTVARAAAQQLSWLTPDTFIAVMREAERSNDC